MQPPHQCRDLLLSPGLMPAELQSPPLPALLERDSDSSAFWRLSPVPQSDSAIPRHYSSAFSLSSDAFDTSLADIGCRQTVTSPLPLPGFSTTSSSSPPPNVATTAFTSPSRTSAFPAPVDLQHRITDAHRRRKEKAALRRLEELCAADSRAEVAGEQLATSATTTASLRQRRQKRKRKLSVLEASAARIERLERLLAESRTVNRMSELHMRLMSEEIGTMVSRERQSLLWMDGSRSLRGSSLLDARFAFTLMQCRTGRLLDANQRFFSLTGYTPGGVMQRILDPVLATLSDGAVIDDSFTPPKDIVLVRAKRPLDVSSVRAQTAWIPLQPCRQYPRTIQVLQDLFTGGCDSCRGTFRCRFADGGAYEIKAHFWSGEVEWVQEEDGRRWRRPVSLMVAASLDECRAVDEG